MTSKDANARDEHKENSPSKTKFPGLKGFGQGDKGAGEGLLLPEDIAAFENVKKAIQDAADDPKFVSNWKSNKAAAEEPPSDEGDSEQDQSESEPQDDESQTETDEAEATETEDETVEGEGADDKPAKAKAKKPLKLQILLPLAGVALVLIYLIGTGIVNLIDPPQDSRASTPSSVSVLQRMEYLSDINYQDSSYKAQLAKIGSTTSDSSYQMPEGTDFTCTVSESTQAGMQVYTLNDGAQGKTILYLHGGSYVSHPTLDQWSFCNTLAMRTGSRVVVPIYWLTPQYDFSQSFPMVLNLYEEMISQYGASNIIVVGDDAGGGLATELCQNLEENELDQPAELILISPWLDVSLSNPDISSYSTSDMWSDPNELRVYGESWAGDIDTMDPVVSPLFGSVTGFPKTLIITSDSEIFYPDTYEFSNKLSEKGVKNTLLVGEDAIHSYPILYPDATNSRDAINTICLDILNL